MLGQGVEVGALFGLRPEDAQRLKGRAARGRQRCCRASGGCADCRRSGRRAQEEGDPSVRCADSSPYTGEPKRRRPKPPLCKGRWHSEAVTEGFPPLSGKFPRESPPPSQPLVFLQMLGQGVEVGALFGLGPEDAQGVKGRAARGRQRCCRASGSCADCRRSGRRAQEGNPSVRCADSSPLRTETTLRDVPVLRMAFFPKRAYDALFSKTHMLQVRCAHPTGVFAPEASPV